MSSELVAMLGGGITGFVMKFMSAQMEIHSKALKALEEYLAFWDSILIDGKVWKDSFYYRRLDRGC